jgi:hypothetical protein
VDVLAVILTVALLGVVVFVVSAPLRAVRRPGVDGVRIDESGADRAGLQAAREAKYREIRDTELDFRTGKLSPEDYQSIDADLRAEAIEILNELDELKPKDA